MSSGLLNSASFVSEMLSSNGVEAKVSQVIDNNAIDREVAAYKPSIVIIEALWVVPEKFQVLTKLHPNVKWVIRLHSNSPFAAFEGNFTDWVQRYLDYGPNVFINANAHEMFSTLNLLLENKYRDQTDLLGNKVDVAKQVSFLPNYYPVNDHKAERHSHHETEIQVGCFGAIRPLKDQLVQAIAAIRFAECLGKPLAFHINVGRFEGGGSPILKNLQNLFAQQPNARLIEHTWMSHADFIAVVKQMDLGSQVSFSETFNIVSADLVNQNIPIVVSSEISWIDPKFYASTTSVAEIAEKMSLAYHADHYDLDRNKERLRHYSERSERLWLDFVAKMG